MVSSASVKLRFNPAMALPITCHSAIFPATRTKLSPIRSAKPLLSLAAVPTLLTDCAAFFVLCCTFPLASKYAFSNTAALSLALLPLSPLTPVRSSMRLCMAVGA